MAEQLLSNDLLRFCFLMLCIGIAVGGLAVALEAVARWVRYGDDDKKTGDM